MLNLSIIYTGTYWDFNIMHAGKLKIGVNIFIALIFLNAFIYKFLQRDKLYKRLQYRLALDHDILSTRSLLLRRSVDAQSEEHNLFSLWPN